jgi:hypothetical protein
VTVFPGSIRHIQPSVSLAELKTSAHVKEQLKSIVADLQAHAKPGPAVALFVSKSPENAGAAAEALAHALNKSLVHVDAQGGTAGPTANAKVNLQQAVQTLDQRQVILFFDEADSLFHKRTSVRSVAEGAAETSETLQPAQALSSFNGLSIVSARTMPETTIENLRYTVRLSDDAA